MFRSLLALISLTVMACAAAAQTPESSPRKAQLLPTSLHPPVISPFDERAESQLLELVNQARAQAGLSTLANDPTLTDAARQHAAMMADERHLSHRFSGELDLAKRVAAVGELHMDRAAENVGAAITAEQAQQAFMNSKPHRDNLMNPAYNLAGIGVVRSGSELYVVQDFGHGLPVYSPEDAEQLGASTMQRIREKAGLASLRRVLNGKPESIACAMAKENSLKAGTVEGFPRFVLRYISNDPAILPASATQSVSDRTLRSFAIGSCYATTPTYPNGAYWMALLLY